jgi:hypothetical protein
MSNHYHGKSATFFFNEGFHGEVTIVKDPLGHNTQRVVIQADDILGLVAEYVRSELVEDVRKMRTDELLKRLR